MTRFRVFAALALGLAVASRGMPAAVDSIDLYEIRDPSLVVELYRAADFEGEPTPGNYQVLVRKPAGTSQRKAFLLREGTQAVELPEFSLSFLQGGRAKRVDPEESTVLREPETNLWRGFWKRKDSVFAWLQWPTGLLVNWQTAVTGVESKSEFDRALDFTLMDRPHPWLYLEAGLHRSQYGGALSTSLYDPADTAASPFWSSGHWWWHAALGVPGVKWEVALANRALPEFFWMDPAADSAAKNRARGVLLRQWEKGSALDGNLSQALRVKFGSLRYAAHFDGDAYRRPIQEISLDELPAPFGPWGFGLMFAGPAVNTRFWVDILPVKLGIPAPGQWPSLLRFAFLRLDFAYRDKTNYHLSIATRVSWDNPALRWPGARL